MIGLAIAYWRAECPVIVPQNCGQLPACPISTKAHGHRSFPQLSCRGSIFLCQPRFYYGSREWSVLFQNCCKLYES